MNQPKQTKFSLENRTVTPIADEVEAEPGLPLEPDELDAVTGGPNFPPDDIQVS